MKNLENIFKNIEPKDHRSNHNKNKLKFSGEYFDLDSIDIILEHIRFILDTDMKNFHLKFVINTKYLADETTLILFEMIIYYLLKKDICQITYTISFKTTSLGYHQFKRSNLFKHNTKKVNRVNFIKQFEKKFYIDQYHFRKLCINNEDNRKGKFLSILFSEITSFLTSNNVDEDYANSLSETITEIVGNSLEHSDGDCLLDIKVVYDSVNKFKNINVTTISITDILLGSNIKKYLDDSSNSIYSPRNKIVLEAYNNHRQYFSPQYDIDSFGTISVFQKYVTTRKDSLNTGGTGLTTLIKELKSKAELDYCYVISGNDTLYFKEQFLDLTDDGLIGFNENNNYIKEIPSLKVLTKNKNIFSGTIYNLSFILKGDK